MIKNYYYLIVGLLCVLFAFTHAWNGETTVLRILETNFTDVSTKTIFQYVWHIITVEDLIFGIALLIMASYKDLTKVRLVAGLIAIILIARWILILSYTLLLNISSLSLVSR